jgi:hypothetical protein
MVYSVPVIERPLASQPGKSLTSIHHYQIGHDKASLYIMQLQSSAGFEPGRYARSSTSGAAIASLFQSSAGA